MAALSDYLENKLIDHVFRNISYTVPSTIGIALVTAAPTDSQTGATISEVTGGSYARVAVVPTTANWASTNGTASGPSSGTGGATNPVAAVTFTTATADWGTIVGVVVCDNTTTAAGNALFYGTLTQNKVVSNGDTFSFAAGSSGLQVQIDN